MTSILRVLCPNPGPYTGPGTNTYILGDGESAVIIDPGPVIGAHLDAIVEHLGDQQATAVMVTHTHPDHAPAANPLGERLGVQVLGYGPGPSFSPDRMLRDGDTVDAGTQTMTAVYTPGHAADHLCYRVGEVLFTGDHIMEGSTVVIEDAAAYMRSLQLVLEIAPSRLYPGHGGEIADAEAAVRDYIAHRRQREDQIVAAVGGGATTAAAIVEAVYGDIDPALHPAALHQVRVQLEKLKSDGRIRFAPWESSDTVRIVPGEGR